MHLQDMVTYKVLGNGTFTTVLQGRGLLPSSTLLATVLQLHLLVAWPYLLGAVEEVRYGLGMRRWREGCWCLFRTCLEGGLLVFVSDVFVCLFDMCGAMD